MKSQPFILPLLGLIGGIVLADFSPNGKSLIAILLLFILLIFLFFSLQRNSIYYSGLILLFFTLFSLQHTKNYNQYTPIDESILGKEVLLKLKIVETYRSSEKYKKYKAEILQIDSFTYSKTNILFYLNKEKQDLYTGDKVWISSKIHPTPKSLNPHQFDYSKYLKRQRIHYNVFSNSIILKENGTGFIHYCSLLKKDIYNSLLNLGYDKQSADQIGAMLLGDRTEMNREVEDSYRKTGVVHILSISGLHIIMVYSIFYFLLYPLIYIKNGKSIRIFLSLILIWAYVLLVGFFPPVLRSAIMIAIYHITVAVHRNPNIYHTLAVSAFILLIINPNFLFDVGFQLSFSAVFFIVFFHKAIQPYIKTKSKTLKYLYNFIATCTSAQMGTLPFTILYFNQTSGLFLFGNIVLISASYIMMIGGMISIALLLVGWDFVLWRMFFDWFMKTCNQYIAWLSSFDFFVFDSLFLTTFDAILLFIGLIIIRYIIIQAKFKRVFTLLFLILLFQASRFYHQHQINMKNELIIFNFHKNTIIGKRKGSILLIYMDDLNDSARFQQYTLRSYAIKEKIKTIHFKSLNQFNSNQDLNPNYLLIQKNTTLHKTTSLDSNTNNMIFILDGSSYNNHRKKFSSFNVWDTKVDGALIIDLSKNEKSHP